MSPMLERYSWDGEYWLSHGALGTSAALTKPGANQQMARCGIVG